MKLPLLTLLVCSMCVCIESREPGLRVRLSRPGIAYAANVAVNILKQKVTTITIPDQSGSKDMSIGKVDYTISNIRVQEFSPPKSSVRTKPFTWSLKGTTAKLTADWAYKYKKAFIHISDHGSLDIKISLNLDTTVNFGMDKTGRPSIHTDKCNCDVTNVDVHFHGGASWLYNLFDGQIEDAIKENLESLISQAVKDEINQSAESALQNIPMEVEFQNTVILDYSLSSAPNLTTSYIDFLSKGEFYWKNDRQKYPYPAHPTEIPPESHMLAFWITEYTINTLGYTEYKHGALQYNLTKSDLPDGNRYILDTTCKSLLKPCIGVVIPKLGQLFPNSTVMLDMAVSAAPQLRVNHSALSGDWTGIIKYRLQSNGKFLFSTFTNVSFAIDAAMRGNNVTANITQFGFNLALAETNIGNFSVQSLKLVMDLAIKGFVIPKLNELGNQGFTLPTIKDVEYANPVVELLNHSLYVGVDLKYNPT